MASLDIMYNSSKQKPHHNHNHNNNNNNNNHNHNHHCAPMSPRISFSNDFVDLQQVIKQERASKSSDTPTTVSSDFEFSVTNYSMMSADELFSKGRLLPYKDNCNNKRVTTTLKQELLHNDDECDSFSLRPPKGRWKGLLGLRKSHIGSKKVDKSEPSDLRRPNEGPQFNFNSQELVNEGSSSY
ncbi:unnamed protein product [Trifolium pratense]|uniref:Uncharacterized protein n=1 Tax=Trifolium pratense TaxID=57577 RepID=A0ACB0JPJ1_TRIPR|nr:unnamed protein product [Trifolium pratense]